jgi:integrase
METFITKEQWRPGQYGRVRFYDRRRSKDARPGCKWHAQIECRDYDPKLFKSGTRKLITRKVNFYGKTEAEAHQKVEAFKKELAARFPAGVALSEGRSRTVAEIIDAYIASVTMRLPHRTLNTYRSIANHVKAKLGEMSQDDLKPTIIEAALWEPRRPLAKEAIAMLRRAITLANKDRETSYNPCTGVDKVFQKGLKVAPEHTRKRGAVSEAQIKTLLETVARSQDATQWLAFFFLMAFAGPRIEDVLLAQIDNYDAHEGTLFICKAKTEAGVRHIVLGRTGRDLIEAQIKALRARGYNGPWLFPAKLGNPYSTSHFYEYVFDPLMLAAGMAVHAPAGTPQRYQPAKLRSQPGIDADWTPHWFRHYARTRDVLALVPPPIIDAQMGWANEQTRHDPNAVRLPYTHAENPVGFPKRRPYAEQTDAVVRALLPRRLAAVAPHAA